MGLIRFFLIVCLAWLAFMTIQKLIQAVRQGHVRWIHDKRKNTVAQKPMVQCAHCNVYMPKEDALHEKDSYFCCADHVKAEKIKS